MAETLFEHTVTDKEGQKRREEQLRQACERAKRTGEIKNLNEYLKMKRE